MVLSALLVYAAIGLFDFLLNKKKLGKKECRIYVVLYMLFLVVCVLTYLDKIPHRFSYITKVW